MDTGAGAVPPGHSTLGLWNGKGQGGLAAEDREDTQSLTPSARPTTGRKQNGQELPIMTTRRAGPVGRDDPQRIPISSGFR